MNGRKIIGYILAITLFAAPAFGQIIPRAGGGGGGGGGGGDASAANQATQISALPLEDTVHTTGDRGSFILGIMNEGGATFGTVDGDYTGIATDRFLHLINAPVHSTGIAAPLQISKREDLAHFSNDAGIPAWAVRNDNAGTTFTATDGDYTAISATRQGILFSVPVLGVNETPSLQTIAQEDIASGAADAGTKILSIRDDVLGAGAGVGADGDYFHPRGDNFGSAWGALSGLDGAALARLEDTGHTTGDGGLPIFGVASNTLPVRSTNGDYVNPAMGTSGAGLNTIVFASEIAGTISAVRTEDTPPSASGPGVLTLSQRDDVLEGDAGTDTDGDLTFPRVDNTGAAWVRNATVTKELFAAASASGTSLTVDTAGYTMGMIHYTTGGTWDRSGTWAINQSIGTTSPFKPAVGAIEVRQDGGTDNVWRHVDPEAVGISGVVDRVRGYMINLMGFQALQVELTLTGGTTGTVEFHVHLYSGGSGFNREMSLGSDTFITPSNGGPPPLIQMVGGLASGGFPEMRALFIPDRSDASGATEAGITAMFINNEDTSVIEATDGDYMPAVTDDAGRQIMILSHNEAIASSLRATHLEDNAHTSGDAGVFALAMRNSTPTPTATTALNLDYSPIGVSNLTQVLTVLHHNSAYLGTINISKQEDVGHGTTDAGIPAWAVRNDNLGLTFSGATGDYTPQAVTRHGASIGIPFFGINESASLQLGDQEDIASASGDGGMKVFTVRDDVLEAGAAVSADGDFTWLRVDNRGGLWTAQSGASFFAITDAAIVQVSQNFAFGFTSKKVMVVAPSTNTDTLCVDWIGGTAICPATDVAGDDILEPGDSLLLEDFAGTSISAISASGTQAVVVRAWN